MKLDTMVMIFLCLLCAACAHKQELVQKENTLEVVTLSSDATLASFIGQGSEGESRFFDDTSYGTSVSVTIGKSYMSSLGIECRNAYITAGAGKRMIAACRGKDYQWDLAPDIFVPGVF